MKLIILICFGFQLICSNPNGSANDIDEVEGSLADDTNHKIITAADDARNNDPKGPCDEDYWSAKLEGTTRDDKTYLLDGEKVIELKRKAFLGGCDVMTRNLDPNRLVFYFKDDDCMEFDFAMCN